MRELLAERLLARVMGWSVERTALERPVLQTMAAYKYDAYKQYSTGQRFVESLAQWLNQFATPPEREAAYDFVKKRLIFCSGSEIAHFVSIAYPDYIRPHLLTKVAHDMGLPQTLIGRIVSSRQFELLQRRCLFLGLSDGARIDVFRRSTPQLSNEQVCNHYDLTEDKAEDMLNELSEDVEAMTGTKADVKDRYFRFVFLLDDFSGSGFTNLRYNDSKQKFSGKIVRFWEAIQKLQNGKNPLLNVDDLELRVVFYVATSHSIANLEQELAKYFESYHFTPTVEAIQVLNDDSRVAPDRDSEMTQLINTYYDPAIEDKHLKRGGKNAKYGFRDCALPIVLVHNTPNNSIALLWATTSKMTALFPRVSRHRS